MRCLIFSIFPFFISLSLNVTNDRSEDLAFKTGDIIFQTSQSSQSKAIQLATKSKYSHVGLIYNIDREAFVYEAVQPVKITRLNDWIKRGDGSHYVVKRLKESADILTDENQRKMKDFGERYKGKNYDLYFEWSDDRIYCSELVWKIYKERWALSWVNCNI